MAFGPGDTVGSFRLDRTMHRDPSRSVFAATNPATGERVTVTMLVVPLDERTVLLERLAVVARLAEHPHLAAVGEWGESDGGVFYAADLVEGVSLAEWLRRQPAGRSPTVIEALDVLADVAHGIDAVHDAGLAHGAVSPDTVMVGLTRPRRAVLDVPIGTSPPRFRAPELDTQPAEATEAGDVYAFGRLATELLVGPPDATAPTRPTLPDEVVAALASATDLDPEARPTSCTDVVTALRTALVPAPSPPAGGRLFASQLAAPRPSRSSRRTRRLVVVAAAIVGVVAIGAAIGLSTTRRSGVAAA